MTKAKNRRSKVKGAVLLMVLAVMVVLIIMLAGAMTIVSTAGSRAVTQYEESQAYYSARSGLDVVTNVILSDSVHKDKNDANDGNNKKSQNVINESNPSQGLVLQEAIIGQMKTVTGTSNIVYDVSKSLSVYDKTKSATDPVNQKSYMKFNVTDMNSYTDAESGLFSDKGDGNIEVKIQLLELVFDDGNTGINRNSVTSTTAALNNGDETTQYIKSCKIKVSCTARYAGTSSTISVVLSPYAVDRTAAEGVVSTGGLNMSTNSNVLGGSASATTFSWGNTGTTVGGSFINQSTTLSTQKQFVLKSSETVAINGNFTVPNNLTVTASKPATTSKEHPFVFINGTLWADCQTQFGDRSVGQDWAKVDLITRNIDYSSGNNPVNVYGDTYVDGYIKLTSGGLNYNGSAACFDGNLFISDRQGILAANSGDGGIGLNNTGNPWNKKSEFKTIQSVNLNGVKLDFVMSDPTNGGNKLMSDIANNAGNGFCSGEIYYYYYERYANSTSQPHEYYGCVEMEAIRQFLIATKDTSHTYHSFYASHKSNIDSFLARLHPMNPDPDFDGSVDDQDLMKAYDLKYIIQLASNQSGNKPSFIDKMDFTPAGGGGSPTGFNIAIEDEPTYLLSISLPYVDKKDGNKLKRSYVGGKEEACAKSVPTLLSKYAHYFFINKINPDTGDKWSTSLDDNVFLRLNANNTVSEITNFVYKDTSVDPPQLAGGGAGSINWKNALGDIALDLFKFNTTPGYDDTVNPSPENLVTRTWDILNALYQCDGTLNQTTTQNVEFITPAMDAHMNSKINFFTLSNAGKTYMDFSSVGNLDASTNPSMTFVELNPTMCKNQTIPIDTSSGDVIIKLDPGTYQDGAIVVSGGNFCYVMMPGTTNTKFQFWNFGIMTDEYYSNYSSASGIKIGNGKKTTYNSYLKLSSPNIRLYADNGVIIDAYNGGDKATMMGYLYGPMCTLHSNTHCSTSKNVYYDDTHVNSFSMDFIGSALVGNVDVDNGYSFIYVPPTNSNSPGTPTIKWRPYMYSNSDINES